MPTKDTTESLVYNVEQAGKLLGLSRASAYNIAHSGILPTIRLGRRLVVPKIAVERMLNGKKDGMTDDQPAGS